jgi:hypothetical protein
MSVLKRRTPEADLAIFGVAFQVRVLKLLKIKSIRLPKLPKVNLTMRYKPQKRKKYKPKVPCVVQRKATPALPKI